MSNRISDKDKKDWQDFLLKNEKVQDKDSELVRKKIPKTKIIDLHGYSLSEANSIIDKLIRSSYEEGVSKLTVITGKGLHSENDKDPYVSSKLGILKYSIPDYINNQKDLLNMIVEIKDAHIKEGGKGAFHILVKKK